MKLLLLIIVWIIAGALAKAVVPGEAPIGILGDLVVGVVGGVVGGWLVGAFTGYGAAYGAGSWIGSIVVAFLGGVVFLLILRALTRRRVV
jgi:uncharacterized membrane protein YeaQ/YmgE (transglycosylase-associated protein family)